MDTYIIFNCQNNRFDLYSQKFKFDIFNEFERFNTLDIKSHNAIGLFLSTYVLDLILQNQARIQDAIIYINKDDINIFSYQNFKKSPLYFGNSNEVIAIG